MNYVINNFSATTTTELHTHSYGLEIINYIYSEVIYLSNMDQDSVKEKKYPDCLNLLFIGKYHTISYYFNIPVA